ncbi:hypothetical protein FKW77_009408 [Venturia effusa]|uniref:Uncharacterized protein n=1 Tax=Venturia effusa TaxID=50376 RepID=A0A517LG92_9PEZI|nr:hypothetical protein FKW77_009408 [Venturia effusa]
MSSTSSIMSSTSSIMSSMSSIVSSTSPILIVTDTRTLTTPAISMTVVPGMIDSITSCYTEHNPAFATMKAEQHAIEGRRQDCAYDVCLRDAAQNCSTATTTATTTIFWDTLKPAETQAVLLALETLKATPRWKYLEFLDQKKHPEKYPANLTDQSGNHVWPGEDTDSFPMPPPWRTNDDPRSKADQKALKKFGLNQTQLHSTKHTFDHLYLSCSYQADALEVPSPPIWKLNQYLNDTHLLDACDDLHSCELRCANLAFPKDPSKWRKALTIGGPILGSLLLIASVAACCVCCKRRIPKSRLPRQPAVHDPEPAMSQTVRSPTQPPPAAAEQRPITAPTPAPAPDPLPVKKTTVRKVEDAAGAPPVVETTEKTAGAPGPVEEVVEPAVPVSTVPAQVVTRAPAGAL